MLLVDTAGRVRDVSPDDRAETVSTPGGSGMRVLWPVGGGGISCGASPVFTHHLTSSSSSV